MKNFYGSVSFSGSADFYIEGTENENAATDMVFDDIEGLTFHLKDGSKVEITQVDWELIGEAPRGNLATPFVRDFEIEEEL